MQIVRRREPWSTRTSFFPSRPHRAGDRRARPALAGSAPRRCSRAGARVLIASRKAEACEAAAQELSALGPCEGFGGTVASEAGVAALAAETRKRTDALHILVNNAGR